MLARSPGARWPQHHPPGRRTASRDSAHGRRCRHETPPPCVIMRHPMSSDTLHARIVCSGMPMQLFARLRLPKCVQSLPGGHPICYLFGFSLRSDVAVAQGGRLGGEGHVVGLRPRPCHKREPLIAWPQGVERIRWRSSPTRLLGCHRQTARGCRPPCSRTTRRRSLFRHRWD